MKVTNPVTSAWHMLHKCWFSFFVNKDNTLTTHETCVTLSADMPSFSLCVEQIHLSEAFKLKSSCTNCVSRGKLCTEHSFWASLDSTDKRGHEIGQIDWVSFAIGASLVAQMVKNRQSGRLRFDPWVRKIPWRREWLPAPGFLSGEAHRQRKLVGYCP